VTLERLPTKREVVQSARAAESEIAFEIELRAERIDANVGRELCRVTARSDAEARGLRE